MGRVAVDVFSELHDFHERITLEVLSNWIVSVNITFADVQGYLRYHPRHYVRNLMHHGPAFQALVLCWRNGQRSPIHDHQGSSCAVKVLKGVALETVFARADNGMIYPTITHAHTEGSVTASQDADIHQVSNLQADKKDLVTLHVYSPPLFYMNTYSLLDGSVTRFLDPINDDFVGGAGI